MPQNKITRLRHDRLTDPARNRLCSNAVRMPRRKRQSIATIARPNPFRCTGRPTPVAPEHAKNAIKRALRRHLKLIA